jgi:hypothetical protein
MVQIADRKQVPQGLKPTVISGHFIAALKALRHPKRHPSASSLIFFLELYEFAFQLPLHSRALIRG